MNQTKIYIMTEIEIFNPCGETIDFRNKFKIFKGAWKACPRGDWMLELAYELKVDHRRLTLAKGKCAQTVFHLMKDGRSRNAIDKAVGYGNGNTDKEELKKAAADAYAAHAYAYADVYAYAAHADAVAIVQADAHAYAAHAAAHAADHDDAHAGVAAASAANAAAYANNHDADAKRKNQQRTADICREVLTDLVMQKINQLQSQVL